MSWRGHGEPEGCPIRIERLSVTDPRRNAYPLALKFAQFLYKGRQGPMRIQNSTITGGVQSENSPAKPRVDIEITDSSFDLAGTALGAGNESTIEVGNCRFTDGRIDSPGLSVFEDCGFRDCMVAIWGAGERGLVFNNCTFEQTHPGGDTFVWYVVNDRRPRPVVLVGNRRVGGNRVRLRVGTGSPDLISLTAISNVLDLPAAGNTLLAPGVDAFWRGNSFPNRTTAEEPFRQVAYTPMGKTRAMLGRSVPRRCRFRPSANSSRRRRMA